MSYSEHAFLALRTTAPESCDHAEIKEKITPRRSIGAAKRFNTAKRSEATTVRMNCQCVRDEWNHLARLRGTPDIVRSTSPASYRCTRGEPALSSYAGHQLCQMPLDFGGSCSTWLRFVLVLHPATMWLPKERGMPAVPVQSDGPHGEVLRMRCQLSIGVVSLVLLTTAVSAFASEPPASPTPPPAATQSTAATPELPEVAANGFDAPKPGEVVRISGDEKQQPVRTKEGGYTLPGTALRITAPLPEGYPAPTPPGAIELKTYPSVRRAEYAVAGDPASAMFKSFRPLYNHISGRKIPMTSPVEMDFPPAAVNPEKKEEAGQPQTWKVSFLYRTKELGATGTDGKVTIVDTAETTVISIGIDNLVVGSESVVGEEEALRKWLSSQDQWESVGEPRSLGYTGPGEEPWSELQLPVRRKDAAAKAAQTPSSAPASELQPAHQGAK